MFKKFFKKFLKDDTKDEKEKDSLIEEEKVEEELVDKKFFDDDLERENLDNVEDDIDLNYHEQIEDEITQEEMDEIDFKEVIEESESNLPESEQQDTINLDYYDKETEISQEEMDEMDIEEIISEDNTIDNEEDIPFVQKNETENKIIDEKNDRAEKIDQNIEENFVQNEQTVLHEDKSIENTEEKKAPEKKSFFERLKSGLFKTRDAMNSAIDNLINGKAKIDDDLYDELEEIMISADMGVETTISTIDELRDVVADNHIRDPKQIKVELEKLLRNKLKANNQDNSLNIENGKQSVILVIGVNGVGKTTTIGKLAYNLKKDGKSVMIAAGDTFRAAAIEQLGEWANRVDVPMISTKEGSDPASVVFDAIKSQKANNTDILIIDTAGRLHNKVNLMNELEKINRIISREHPDANKEILLVLDATTGQNALFQAKEFNKVTKITGLVLTKLDGTAKGGVVFPLQVENNIPVKFIGIGEQKDNLEKFDSDKFVDALFSK